MTQKIAIVLMNLGGPLKEADIAPFLFNFFMDKNIIAAPLPIRFILAKWISWRRSKKTALTAYRQLGGKSPLLENTQKQAEALQAVIQKQYPQARVFISMRYWHPLAEETIKKVEDYNPDKIILLPLYPQFSTTTTGSSFQDWKQKGGKAGVEICCYPLNEGFIKASADNIRHVLQTAPAKTRLLFSAHGLPEKIIEGGDPYQWQCLETANRIVAELKMPELDWQICYQSRVGPLKWIGPSTEEALYQAAQDNMDGILVYPHAFVSEHVETLVEIEQEYRHLATSMGILWFRRVETVGIHPDFIKGLAQLVTEAVEGKPCKKICPEKFRRCLCKEQK